jgi:DNA-binding MarR family transcriptional regulator
LSIKEDIKAKGFQSEQEKAFVNLIFTAAHFESLFLQLVKAYDISSPQYNVLRILRGQHPDTMLGGDLQSRMLHNKSNSTRLVDKLVDKGLVDRTKNPEDKRQMLMSITTSGLALLSELDVKVVDFDQKIMNLPQAQLIMLNNLLDDLRSSSLI